MASYSAFTSIRGEALTIIDRVWGELWKWRMHCEAIGEPGSVIDNLARAIRDLDKISTLQLSAEIRRLERPAR